MPSTFKTLILALLATFSFVGVSKIAYGKEFHEGWVAEAIILDGEILSSQHKNGVFSLMVKSSYFGQPEPDLYYCELTPNSYSCFRPIKK